MEEAQDYHVTLSSWFSPCFRVPDKSQEALTSPQSLHSSNSRVVTLTPGRHRAGLGDQATVPSSCLGAILGGSTCKHFWEQEASLIP